MYCKYCGSIVPGDSDFCHKCGKSLKGETLVIKKERKPRKLAIILGITIPTGVILITFSVLVLMGYFPFWQGSKDVMADTAEEQENIEVIEWEDIAVEEEENNSVEDERFAEFEDTIDQVLGLECEITFINQNVFEIGQDGLDQGYPKFIFNYPDNWDVTEFPLEGHGYTVFFTSPVTLEVETANFGIWDQPLIEERIFILNNEYASRVPHEIIDEWWGAIFDEPYIEILEYSNNEEEFFIIIWKDISDNIWFRTYRFITIDDHTLIYMQENIEDCSKVLPEKYVVISRLQIGDKKYSAYP